MHVCKYVSLSMVVIVIVVVVDDDDDDDVDDDVDDDACVENSHRAIWSCVKHCNRMNPSC